MIARLLGFHTSAKQVLIRSYDPFRYCHLTVEFSRRNNIREGFDPWLSSAEVTKFYDTPVQEYYFLK